MSYQSQITHPIILLPPFYTFSQMPQNAYTANVISKKWFQILGVEIFCDQDVRVVHRGSKKSLQQRRWNHFLLRTG